MIVHKSNSMEKGSITIEAAIVVPVVIFSILAIMYMALLLYQQAYLQSETDYAVSWGAASWDKSFTSIETVRVEKGGLGGRGLYWRIYDQNKNLRKSIIEEYIDRRITRYGILHEKSRNIDVQLKDYIIYKKLVVIVECSYKYPIGDFLKIFGLKSEYIIRVKSEAVINEPVELIRNTDFILDIERKLERKYSELRELGDKTRELIDSVKEFVKGKVK